MSMDTTAMKHWNVLHPYAHHVHEHQKNAPPCTDTTGMSYGRILRPLQKRQRLTTQYKEAL